MSLLKRNAPENEEDEDEFGSVSDGELLSLATSTEADIHDAKRRKLAGDDQCQAQLLDLLQNTFKLRSFRLAQKEVITRLVHGQSAVVVFPTGGGKSLCYQLPALAIEGLTLVVSPLIALMKDQTHALQQKGIPAATIDSSKSREEYLSTMALIRSGHLKLLFVAPERLNNEGFIETMTSLKGGVSLVAIDEAHCISEWGHAFRPDYLKVARFVEEVKAPRVVCLTATATPRVALDICRVFGVDESGLFRTSSYRPNLQLLVESIDLQSKPTRLAEFLKANPGTSIVYVTLQKQAEEVALALKKEGFKTAAYHAGMETNQRVEAQEAFMKVKNIIVVATIAFGMGIDKADIRNVVHYDMPRSLEGYSQEIGRAGRDDKPSSCLLFLCGDDLKQRENFARSDLPSLVSVQGFMREFLGWRLGAAAGEILEAKKYAQSKDWDIRATSLGNIYASLELHSALIREITPKYGSYQYKLEAKSYQMRRDQSPEALAILRCAKSAKIWTHVDIDIASKKSGVDRVALIRKLQHWHDFKVIELKASDVVNRFKVLNRLPSSKKDVDLLAVFCHEILQKRESDEIARYQSVVAFATSKNCLASTLAQHFGDTISGERCGNCSFCITGDAAVFNVPWKKPFNKQKLEAILKACPVRDDARLLARVAFGISSPRITALKISKLPVFGSVDDCSFEDLLRYFETCCEEYV